VPLPLSTGGLQEASQAVIAPVVEIVVKNQDAVRLMKKLYGIDMEKTQYSKLVSEIPSVDIVITTGCNVECPYLPCRHREDWGLDDPTEKSDEEFITVIRNIENKIKVLSDKIVNKLIP